ncbi:MAG: DUF3617 family protein [Aquabacterium sp.]|jgi:hypothetical protein|nr:MAG: DUF3617 family protein [Aquabacterium sp.]
MKNWFSPAAAGIVLACAAIPTGACAQSLDARPGLWAEASSSIINGKAMPTIFDVKGGLPAGEKARIKQVMAKLGLPPNWNPKLQCLTKASFDSAEVIRKAAASCPSPSVKARGNEISYSARCQEQGTEAQVTGNVRAVSDTEIRSNSRVEAQVQGQKVVSEHQTVSKWLGADCTQPPAGIDPQWLAGLGGSAE